MFSLTAHFNFLLLTFQDAVNLDILQQESLFSTEVSSKMVPEDVAMDPHGLVCSSDPYWILRSGVELWFSLVVCLDFVVFCLNLFVFKEAKINFFFLKISELRSFFLPFTSAGGKLYSECGQVTLNEAPSVTLPLLAAVLGRSWVVFLRRAYGYSSKWCIQHNFTVSPANPDSLLMLTPTALSYALKSCGYLHNPTQVEELLSP